VEDQNRALGNAGVPIRLPVGDKTYLVSACTKRIQLQFQEWLKERAKKEVLSTPGINTEQAGIALAKVAQDAAAGQYAWTGQAGFAARRTYEGIRQMLYFLLRQHQPAIEDEEVEAIMEDYTDAATAAIKESIDRGNRKTAAPTPAAAA
jgi:hypothetical protein